jgi:hypothetical protein
MKKNYNLVIALFVVFFVVLSSIVSAQSTTDTVFIPGSSSLIISDIINADTSVTAHRVYVLDRGAIYYIDRAFELTHSCEFTARGSAARPPVIAAGIRGDGTNEEWFFKLVEPGTSVYLNNIYILSMRPDNKTLGWSRAIHIGANNVSLKMRNVVLDAFTEAGIRIDGADFVKLDVQDCHFRNFIHSTSYFGGQPFLSNGNDHPDTTIFINNTFFACNSYLFSVRGLGPKSEFSHNSVVYSAVNPFLTRQADNLFVKNNLFYATHAWGGDPEQVIGGWFLNYPDTVSSGIMQYRKHFTNYHGYGEITGPEVYYTDLGLIFDPSQRVAEVHQNGCFWPSKLVDFYTAWNDTVTIYDSVEVILGPKQYLRRVLSFPRWINDLGYECIDSLTNPSQWDYSSHVNFDPAAVTDDPQFSDAGVVGHIDSLVAYVKRIASRKLDNPWHYELNFPPVWPIPENLAFTNSALLHAGTDGYALGDLNWFPDQKAQWIINDVKMESAEIPDGFELSNAYPNPFNPETNVKFSIPQTSNVKLIVYNLLGQEVKTLLNKEMQPGSFSASWNGLDNSGNQVSSGIYFLTLESQSFKATTKMMLMK